MVQSYLIQVDVAFLTYNEQRNVSTPIVKLDQSCVAGLSQLKRHRDSKRKQKDSMGHLAYHHYKWYNSMLVNELRRNGADQYKLKICHWHIESGNKEAFKMNEVLYKSVSIIITPEMEHWYCANNGGESAYCHGSRYRNLSVQTDHQLNTSKMANLALNGNNEIGETSNKHNKPTLPIVKVSSSKCTQEKCANNCMECKKFMSPFSNKKSKCACYIQKKLRSIDETDESDSTDSDIAFQDIVVINNLKKK